MPPKPGVDGLEEGIQVAGHSLGDQLDASVGKIPHVTSHRIAGGHISGRQAEADSLDRSTKQNRATLHQSRPLGGTDSASRHSSITVEGHGSSSQDGEADFHDAPTQTRRRGSDCAPTAVARDPAVRDRRRAAVLLLSRGRRGAGEDEPAAVARELREELAIDVRPVARLWESQTVWNVDLSWWQAELVSPIDDVAPNPNEVAQALWLPPETIAELPNLLSSNHEFLEAWRSGGIRFQASGR